MSIELDLELDDLDETVSDETISDETVSDTEKQKHKKMNFKAVNSNSTSTTIHSLDDDHLNLSHSNTNSCTTIEEEEEEEEEQKQKNNKKALNISVTSIDEKEYDSDYGTAYHDKYSMINQCSPSIQTPNTKYIDNNNNNHHDIVGMNYEIFNVQPTTRSISSQSPNTLNPSLLFGKFDQFSHSETYQSQSTDSINSMDNDANNLQCHQIIRSQSTETINIIKDNDNSVIINKSQQSQETYNKTMDNNLCITKSSKKWFNFLSTSSLNDNHGTNNKHRRRSTLSALFNSFINHNSYVFDLFNIYIYISKKKKITDTSNRNGGNNENNNNKNGDEYNEDDDDDMKDIIYTKNYNNNNNKKVEGNINENEMDDIIMKQFGICNLSDLIDKLNGEELKYGRDNGKYLILNSYRILNEEFEPKFLDLLQCHVRSTGLMFENHVMCRSLPISSYNKLNGKQEKEDIVFRVVDVGGHRNERKKWTYVLKQDNDVIVFVVSAASFCQVLFEDFKKNAMEESLDVWRDILKRINNQNNDNDGPQFILVINKIDLFYQRCHLFKQYFSQYNGDINNKYQILNYIKSLYLNVAKEYNQNKNVHCVCTKLTDSLEIASFDVEQIKNILMNYNGNNNNKDIVDIIIDYAIGDVFWSQKWLKPMWQRKMMKKHKLSPSPPPSPPPPINKERINHCDHVNYPHDYRKHSKTTTTTHSFTNRLSSIFQSRQD